MFVLDTTVNPHNPGQPGCKSSGGRVTSRRVSLGILLARSGYMEATGLAGGEQVFAAGYSWQRWDAVGNDREGVEKRMLCLEETDERQYDDN